MAGSAYISTLVLKSGCKIIINDIDPYVIEKINYAADELVTKMNTDFSQVFNATRNEPDTVFYCDPPYQFETRSYQDKIYKYEWQNGDHSRFLNFIKKVKHPVIISHYPCKLYNEALKAWRKVTYNAMTRAGIRKECLWMNYQQPLLLQCPQFVGNNFTDRQRIKRKVNTYVSKLKNETDKERAAILSSIIDQFGYVISAGV